MTRFIVYTILILVFILGAVLLEGGALAAYLAFTPFMVVFLVPVFAMFAVWGFREIGRAFRNALGGNPDPGSMEVSIQLWGFCERTIYAAAALGLILGLVLIFGSRSELGDPAALGRPIAFGLLTLVYGFFLGILSRILRTRVEERR
jgi:flagellar motor component MotA